MEELNIEQKAQRYDEAKYIMKKYLESGNAGVIAENTIKKAFPELKESEDEKIRKWLICYFKEVCDNVSEKEKKGVLAWLEKQGEQKPTEWSEKTKGLDELETYILSIVPNRPLDAIKVDSKNIRFLINKEQKPAWSEEDEYHKRQILRILKDNGCSQTLQERTEKWIEERLKSLRPQNTWKPSDEQMEALEHFIVYHNGSTNYAKDLEELRLQLKKLREE